MPLLQGDNKSNSQGYSQSIWHEDYWEPSSDFACIECFVHPYTVHKNVHTLQPAKITKNTNVYSLLPAKITNVYTLLPANIKKIQMSALHYLQKLQKNTNVHTLLPAKNTKHFTVHIIQPGNTFFKWYETCYNPCQAMWLFKILICINLKCLLKYWFIRNMQCQHFYSAK